ncbi:hypothetical protein EVAR_93430_1 [Eumeta japonica]|uniref:Uncharacterized protein n=1 Tax=Eumeta variegata TaxID=151549 RepID=A0A4C1UPT9_EUMVA|nr:hypothetical protein EVAR_93430_1 [Eumeta japonica]
MDLTHEHFSAIVYYDFRRGLTQKQCIDQLVLTLEMKRHRKPLGITDLVINLASMRTAPKLNNSQRCYHRSPYIPATQSSHHYIADLLARNGMEGSELIQIQGWEGKIGECGAGGDSKPLELSLTRSCWSFQSRDMEPATTYGHVLAIKITSRPVVAAAVVGRIVRCLTLEVLSRSPSRVVTLRER